MGMESQTSEQPSQEALLELGFGPDPPAELIDRVRVDASDVESEARVAETTADDLATDSEDLAADSEDLAADSLESAFEADPSLVPAGASALLVAPSVLDPQEVEALLSGLHSLLEETSAAAAANAVAVEQHKDSYESDSQAIGCDRRHSQFPSLAWLFPNH